jgi:hypothetical protein
VVGGGAICSMGIIPLSDWRFSRSRGREIGTQGDGFLATFDSPARGVADKKRVGVASNSHKAINNLLKDVESVAKEKGVRFSGIKGSSKEEQYFRGTMIANADNNGAAATQSNHQLIAGTAWLFARPDLDQALDYLFIDEAGQVSLANVIGMGVSAKNIVLVGDQMGFMRKVVAKNIPRSGGTVANPPSKWSSPEMPEPPG